MASPYLNPDFDGTSGHDGSAYLFPVKQYDVDNPDLAAAVNALFFDDASRWPTTYSATAPYAAGSKVPLATTLVDCPDANAVANWLAYNDADQKFIPGASYWATLPSWVDLTHDDAAGTIPYINPATSCDPDAVYALNYLLDNSGIF
jgi:hypothetical protein